MRTHAEDDPALRRDSSEAGTHALGKLSAAQREKLLRSSWMYHDYQWFRYVGERVGFEEVNGPNQDILERMAEAEMRRLMRALRLPAVDGMQTLVHLLDIAGGLYVGDLCPMTLEVEAHSFRLQTQTCFAHQGTLRAGLSQQYKCGPMRRVTGWLRGMDLSFEVSPAIGLCLLSCGQACSYQIHVRFP
jgi:hypothetical protein